LSAFLLDRLGHDRLGDLLLVLVDLGLDLVEVPELLLDRLELLAQEVLALRLGHLLLDPVLDLRTELEYLDLLAQKVHGARSSRVRRARAPRVSPASLRP
jgi:hypothetical protein